MQYEKIYCGSTGIETGIENETGNEIEIETGGVLTESETEVQRGTVTTAATGTTGDFD